MHSTIRCFAATFLLFFAQTLPAAAAADDYENAVSKWRSYEDVARWLDGNFAFDTARLQSILGRTRANGPSGLLARTARGTYEQKSGYCTDAANFALQALNRIDSTYKAQFVFIRNQYGQPHHWVTGFTVNGRIMVMDYGAGPEWKGMKGVHGPYDTLEQYGEFLRSLNIKRFAPEAVEWKPNFPGQED